MTAPRAPLFREVSDVPIDALAIVYDLEGFSQFVSRPDAPLYVPRYLNSVTEAVSTLVYGGDAPWIPEHANVDRRVRALPVAPVERKFLGDGELLLWQVPKDRPGFVLSVLNRFWNLYLWFDGIVRRALEDVHVYQLPRRIRVGAARGPVHVLERSDTGAREYVGHCINLADRLQRYCPELSFIASASIGLPRTQLDKHTYSRVVAKNVRDLGEQIVIVDTADFKRLPSEVRKDLFEELASTRG